MASRRAARILLVIGVILLVVGAIALAVAPAPGVVSETDFLPPGWVNYLEYPKAMVAGGTIQGTWSSANGTPVDVFVYNDADYGSYANGANLTGLFNETAVSGTIAMSVPGFNTYHIVIQHAVGYEDTNVTVTVAFTLAGWDPTATIGGVVALVIGGLVIALSVRRLRAPEAPPGTLPSRATIQGPAAPPQGGWETPPSAPGTFPVPPPLPGSPAGGSPPPAAPSAAAGDAASPVGNVVVTVVNAGAAEASLDLVVNGAAVTHMTVPPGQSQAVNVAARLSSPFGSTVTVEAVLAGGHRAKQAVFVGAKGTAPVTLRIG